MLVLPLCCEMVDVADTTQTNAVQVLDYMKTMWPQAYE